MKPTVIQAVKPTVKPTKQTLLSLLSLLFLFTNLAFANNYWVDGKRGKDVSTGGTRQAPWKTIAYALSQVPSPTNPRYDNAIRIIGGQAYALTQPLQMKYNVRLVGDFVGTTMPVIRGSQQLSSLIHFPGNVIFNRKTAGFSYLILDGGSYGVTMGGTGGKRHRPELLYSRFRGQKYAGILIRQVGTTICDPRFFDCWFTGQPYGIKAEASGANAVLRPDVDECRFIKNATAGFHLMDTSNGAADVGGLVRHSWFEGGGVGAYVKSGNNASNTRIDFRGNHFRNLIKEGIQILVTMPYDPQVLIEDCSFVACGRGIWITGFFPAGVYSFTLQRNVVMKSKGYLGHPGDGILATITPKGSGTISLRYQSEGNLTTRNRSNGFFYNFGSGIQLAFDSFGDRSLNNQGRGTFFNCHSAKASIQFRGGVLANNVWEGMYLFAQSKAKVQFMTFAVNGTNGFYSSSSVAYQMDHCLFAANRLGEVRVPKTQAITYSLFQNQSFSGKGNLRANPKLSRPSYHLLPGSPCIDAGNIATSVPARDYEGDPRILAGKGNFKIPDIGADEFSPTGSAHAYGLSGFGIANFRPGIGVSGSSRDVRIGRSLGITLLNAKDFANYKAGSALLVLGSGETGPLGLLDIGGLGVPGSFLWTTPLLVSPPVTPDQNGFAKITLPIPNSLSIVGVNLSAQWWVFKPFTNVGGFVTTQGLRIQIGK